jgi:hypothetical protein
VTTTRKFAHLVPILCIAAQMAVFSLEFHHWLPITNVWNADMIATLVAVVGSVYAGVKANRWWFVLTGIEALIAILLAVALGG